MSSNTLACKCLDFHFIRKKRKSQLKMERAVEKERERDGKNMFTLIAQSFRSLSISGCQRLMMLSFFFGWLFRCRHTHSASCVQFDFTFILMRQISFWPIPHRVDNIAHQPSHCVWRSKKQISHTNWMSRLFLFYFIIIQNGFSFSIPLPLLRLLLWFVANASLYIFETTNKTYHFDPVLRSYTATALFSSVRAPCGACVYFYFFLFERISVFFLPRLDFFLGILEIGTPSVSRQPTAVTNNNNNNRWHRALELEVFRLAFA